MRPMLTRLVWGAGCAATAAVLVLAAAAPAWAQEEPTGDELATVIGNATAWIVGLLVGLATLFLTIGGAPCT